MVKELTTKQEDLVLDNDSEFLDYEEEDLESKADYDDFLYEVMRDLKFEEEYEKLSDEEKEKLNEESLYK